MAEEDREDVSRRLNFNDPVQDCACFEFRLHSLGCLTQRTRPFSLKIPMGSAGHFRLDKVGASSKMAMERMEAFRARLGRVAHHLSKLR
jgi:hypothetical protein